MTITFTLDIEPKTVQNSNRTMVRFGKALHYVDGKKKSYTKDMVALCSQYSPTYPMLGPISLRIRFYRTRPKYMLARKYSQDMLWCPTRPDVDNLYKGTIDALSKAGFWADDAQIVEAQMSKVFHRTGERPCMKVEVTSADPYPWEYVWRKSSNED